MYLIVCLTIHTSHLTDGKESVNLNFQKNINFLTACQSKDFLGLSRDRSRDFIQQRNTKILNTQMPQCFEGFLKAATQT